jgi:hypothetical protein
MMKKLLAAFVMIMMLGISTVCFAEIAEADLVLGGLYPGQPWSEVIAMYGNPSWEQRLPNRTTGYVYEKPDGQFLLQKENEVLVHITVTTNRAMVTTRGISIGASRDDVIRAYGSPDRSEKAQMYEEFRYYAGEKSLRFSLFDGRLKWINVAIKDAPEPPVMP